MILLDTHVVLWLALEPARISSKARLVIEEARRQGQRVAICDISLLEITTAERKSRITLNQGLGPFLAEVEQRFSVFPITGEICVRAARLPSTYPKDPADRIIAATALVERVPLLTADDAIRRSRALQTIW